MMDNYIWHYYFNLFKQTNKQELIVRKERCVYMDALCKYRVYTNSGMPSLRKSDIGTVYLGRSVFLFERDDEKAMKLFNDYMQGKIQKSYDDIKCYKDILDFANNNTFIVEEN